MTIECQQEPQWKSQQKKRGTVGLVEGTKKSFMCETGGCLRDRRREEEEGEEDCLIEYSVDRTDGLRGEEILGLPPRQTGGGYSSLNVCESLQNGNVALNFPQTAHLFLPSFRTPGPSESDCLPRSFACGSLCVSIPWFPFHSLPLHQRVTRPRPPLLTGG